MGGGISVRDWDAAYHNSGVIQNADEIFSSWMERATAFRETARGQLDMAYGEGERERFDLFLPERETPLGLVIFVHGGYWKAFDKSAFSHLANGAVQMGYAVTIPSYDLCPDVKISHITNQIEQCIDVASNLFQVPLYLTGHSAGGHLVARMACTSVQLFQPVRTRLRHILGISGVYDLRPIRRTKMNEVLHIDPSEARSESPVLLEPADRTRFTGWVGAEELAEFRRQSHALCTVWGGFETGITLFEAPGKNHFTVVEDLEYPESQLLNALLKT